MHQPPIPHVAGTDPEIADLIQAEARRQRDKIRLIPSENYVSVAVLEAAGSVLTNKYSEGYAGRRYYEGQQFIDPLEQRAQRRAEALFGVGADTGRMDMDEVRDLARAERPKIIYCGGTAIPRTIDFPAFAQIAAEVDAVLVADIAHIAGLI